MSKPIWAVELSWSSECYHTNWTHYYYDKIKADEEYRKTLMNELEAHIDDEKKLKKYKKKSNEDILDTIYNLITENREGDYLFDINLYNVLDRTE